MSTERDEVLNIAGQCRATASSSVAQDVLVDAGSGCLRDLLLDAAKAIEALAPQKREPFSLTPREQNELHSVLRQKGNLTQDGCWDAIEVFSQFLKEQHSNE